MDFSVDVKHVPLCVDLDGTLVATDTLWEGLATLLLKRPYLLFHVAFWVFKGKAYLKQKVASYTDSSAQDWPLRKEVLDYIEAAKQSGRKAYLVTGAAKATALELSNHLGIFDGVFHSSEQENLTSHLKAAKLVTEFGEAGFDYIGNSRDDVVVFDIARKGIVVSPDSAARRWQELNDGEEINVPLPSPNTIFKSIRVHQWAKNMLIGVPLVLDHNLFEMQAVVAAIIAFFSFSFFASSVYIVNDLSDLKADRAHAKKRYRPLASGALSIPVAAMTWFALVAASISLASLLPVQFILILTLYAVVTTAYTFVLKRKLLVDVFTLAGLYTIRIIAGAVATFSELSFWLLAFSIFFFLSLALVKRYVEVSELGDDDNSNVVGRGYSGVDANMLIQGGISSAFAATMVLALYINSNEVIGMYSNPWMIWPLVPIILYMQLRIWILAGRGQVHEDPVVFIMRDWRSQLTMVMGGALLLIAMV
ncbi:UbiA family prenyltransferase [Lentilitoribacter sp. EG35]|uniref:UbiA family prenyltransferase n=1 Tax=Lentilitoribacter sp. EG35 TaxID=3234192 RepID=UPI00346071AC